MSLRLCLLRYPSPFTNRLSHRADQVYGASSCNKGRQLAVSGAQTQARQTEVGTADSYIDQGGSGCPDIRTDLLGGGAIGTSVRVRDMGPDAAYDEGIGRISPQGRPQSDGKAAVERGRTEAGFTPLWRMQWLRRGFRSWRLTSPVTRTQWRNILKLGLLWACVWRRNRVQGQGWQCGGGNRRFGIWMGCGQRTGRRSRQRVHRRGTGRRLRRTTSSVGRIL